MRLLFSLITFFSLALVCQQSKCYQGSIFNRDLHYVVLNASLQRVECGGLCWTRAILSNNGPYYSFYCNSSKNFCPAGFHCTQNGEVVECCCYGDLCNGESLILNKVTVPETSTKPGVEPESKPPMDWGIILIIVLGSIVGCLLILIIVICVWCLVKNRKQKKKKKPAKKEVSAAVLSVQPMKLPSASDESNVSTTIMGKGNSMEQLARPVGAGPASQTPSLEKTEESTSSYPLVINDTKASNTVKQTGNTSNSKTKSEPTFW